jgi:ankyrin repeat protein
MGLCLSKKMHDITPIQADEIVDFNGINTSDDVKIFYEKNKNSIDDLLTHVCSNNTKLSSGDILISVKFLIETGEIKHDLCYLVEIVCKNDILTTHDLTHILHYLIEKIKYQIYIMTSIFSYEKLKGENLLSVVIKIIENRNPCHYFYSSLIKNSNKFSKDDFQKIISIAQKNIFNDVSISFVIEHMFCDFYKSDLTSRDIVDTIKILIENGLDINKYYGIMQDSIIVKQSVFHKICSGIKKVNCEDNIELIKFCIEKKADVFTADMDGNTILHLICSNINSGKLIIEIIKYLINLCVNINIVNNGGVNLLHLICSNSTNLKSEEILFIVKFLIENGINVNAVNINNWTALHYICSTSTNLKSEEILFIVKFLIENGINVNAVTINNWTALHYVCSKYTNLKDQDAIDVIKILIENGININAVNNDCCDALHFVTYNKTNLTYEYRLTMIKYFNELGADVNCRYNTMKKSKKK